MSTQTVSSLTWQSKQSPSFWPVSVVLAIFLHVLLVFGGAYSRKDTLLDLISRGETVAVENQLESPPLAVLEVDLAPLPAPEANPEFVLPIDPPPSVATDDEDTADTDEDYSDPAPQPLVATASTPPSTEPIVTPPVEAPHREVVADPSPAVVENATTPVYQAVPAETYADQGFEVGDKDLPKPPYPYEAKLKRYQGTVEIALDVENGVIVNAEVMSSSGYGILDQSAVGWIRRRWKFPEDVSRTLSLPIRFELAER